MTIDENGNGWVTFTSSDTIIDHLTILRVAAGDTVVNFMGGQNCPNRLGLPNDPLCCKEQFLAEIVVGGKIVATIPMDAVPAADRVAIVQHFRKVLSQ